MSEWQPYVDDYMTKGGEGNMSMACIISYPDGALSATSGDFSPQDYTADTYNDAGEEIQIQVSEINGLIESAGADWASAPSGGLRMNKKKYMWLGTGTEMVEDYGMEIKYARAKQGANLSLCMCYSETAILIGVADKSQGHAFDLAIKDMCDLAAYLKSTGY
jgi:hypothetical protein